MALHDLGDFVRIIDGNGEVGRVTFVHEPVVLTDGGVEYPVTVQWDDGFVLTVRDSALEGATAEEYYGAP